MGPGGEHDGSGDRPDASLLQKPLRRALVHQVDHPALVLRKLLVQGEHTLGQTNGLGASCADCEPFCASAPLGDLADPRAHERAAGVDSEVGRPSQSDQRVDPRGALGGHVVASGDQDAQRGPHAGV